MRLAILSLHGCPLLQPGLGEVGGMQLYVHALSRDLGKRGVTADVFTRWHDPHLPPVEELSANVRIIHLAVGPPEEVGKAALERYLEEFPQAVAAYVAQHHLRYDLLHSHYWLSGWVGEQLQQAWGVPHVVQPHTLGALKNRAGPEQSESERRLAVEERLLAGADAIIAGSPQERDQLVYLGGAREDRVEVVPAGVDLEHFHPYDRQAVRAQLGLPERASIVFYAGRIDPFKGLDLFVRALAAMEERENVLALVAGGRREDPEVHRLQELGAELGLNSQVRFLGTVPHEEIPWYYSAANVSVVPSYYETFGLSALEAMACGVPVVATNVGGLQSLVRDGETGYLVVWHCPDPFAEQVELLLHHDALREAMGRAARLRAEEFPWSVAGEAVVRLYNRLLAQARGDEEDREWPR